jgi:transposase
VTTADEDRIAARRAEAIKLRVRGKTIREIAQELGVGVATAHDDVRTAMGEMAKEAEENVAEQRGLELHRLERALEVVEKVLTSAPMADEGGDELQLKALDRLVKIQDQRAKLLGLYAPEKRELSGTLGVGDASPAAAAELVRKKFGGHAARPDSGEAPPADPPVPGSTPGT